MQCVQRIGELCIFYFIQQINLKLHVATVNKTKRQYIKKVLPMQCVSSQI